MKPHLSRSSSKRPAERGQIAVALALLVPILVGLTGLVIDGGLMLVQFRRGQVTVDSAALAAAAKLDEPVFRDENVVQLNTAEAYAAALQYAQANGGGQVAITGVSISGSRVGVSGQVTTRTLFMQIFGIPSVRLSLSSNAELKYGITEEGQ